MNRPIRRVSVAVMLLFAILLVNQTYALIFRHDAVANDPNNRRVTDAQFAQDRGAIMIGNTAIAESVPVNDQYKYQRRYSNGPLYAPITGYFTYNYGQSNLERSYNQQLAGTSDSQALQRLLDQLAGRAPQGATVETTLNAKGQQAAWDALGTAKGAIVAINPQTGAILAMVSTPSYDPNTIAGHNLGAADAAWKALNADPNRPTANRAAREVYPPGSTFKMVTAAAALENGAKPEDLIDTPDRLRLPGTNNYLTNQSSCGNTKITMNRAFENSCNTAFANIGMSLGNDKMAEQAKKFGFGTPLAREVYGVASSFPTGMNQAELAQSSIGQFDVKSTPLQMALIAAGIANNGSVMEPYLVQTVRGPNLEVMSQHTPRQLSQAMTPANAKLLQQMMVNVVTQGSGTASQVPGVGTGGKTGTAQWDTSQPPYAWFTAFGPTPNPTVAIAVFVQDSNYSLYDKTYGGASIAAPMAKKVLQAFLT